MRPRGDPGGLAAAARLLTAAAAEVEGLGRGLRDLDRDVARSDAWRGPASAAYRARDGLLESDLGDAAGALRHAAAGLADLSTGLAGAQAVWDRASSLAASDGLALGPLAAPGPLALPLPSTDPRVVVAARVVEMVREADDQAAVADRTAARRFAEAADTAARAEGRSPLGRGLEVADRVATAVGAGLAAVEARASVLTRLVRSGREPATGLAAVRALAAFERSAFQRSRFPATLAAFLPVGGPVITLAANLFGGEDPGEPMLRAVVRSLGQSLGAEAGQRLGIAMCGVGAAATEGAGAALCPGIAIAATSAGATLGGTAAVRLYDALEPEHPPGPPTGPAPPPPASEPPSDPRPSNLPPRSNPPRSWTSGGA